MNVNVRFRRGFPLACRIMGAIVTCRRQGCWKAVSAKNHTPLIAVTICNKAVCGEKPHRVDEEWAEHSMTQPEA